MDARIVNLLDYIHQPQFFPQHSSPHTDLFSVAALAARAGLSCGYFRAVFKRATGLPPQRYVKRLRLKAARHLLEATRLNLKEIMARTGFSDASHFVKDFRRLLLCVSAAIPGSSSACALYRRYHRDSKRYSLGLGVLA